MKDTLKQFKEDFMLWSGFSFTAENYQDAMDEIKSRTYQLECEISEEGDRLRDRGY